MEMNVDSFPELIAYRSGAELERFPARAPRNMFTLREAIVQYVDNELGCVNIGKILATFWPKPKFDMRLLLYNQIYDITCDFYWTF